jgi:hypothetical protein
MRLMVSSTYEQMMMDDELFEEQTSHVSLTQETLEAAFRWFDVRRPLEGVHEEHLLRLNELPCAEITCSICGEKIQPEDKRTFDGDFCYHTSCYDDFVYIKPQHKEKEDD